MLEWLNWGALIVFGFVVGLGVGIGIALSGPSVWTPGEKREDGQTLHD